MEFWNGGLDSGVVLISGLVLKRGCTVYVTEILNQYRFSYTQRRKQAVVYSMIKYGYYFYLPQAHLWFTSYAPEFVPIFYSVIKHGEKMFYFLIQGWSCVPSTNSSNLRSQAFN